MAGLSSIAVALQGVGPFNPAYLALQGFVIVLPAAAMRRTRTRRVEDEVEETRTIQAGELRSAVTRRVEDAAEETRTVEDG